jgi:hypothetical protein
MLLLLGIFRQPAFSQRQEQSYTQRTPKVYQQSHSLRRYTENQVRLSLLVLQGGKAALTRCKNSVTEML